MIIAGHLVDEAMFSYIARHADADTVKLLLKAEPSLTFDKSFAILQIECRKRSKNKIPELLKNGRFLFPKSISAEQCTHETVARFHSNQFGSEDRVLDMTMGLGVDDYYIAQRVKSLVSIELDPEIAQVGQYNFSLLNPAVTVVEGDSAEYLQRFDGDKFDAIFIDPARRGNSGKRLYGLADCQPNVIDLLPTIRDHAKRLYIKVSPMIDVTQSIRDLGEMLTDIWAVSIKNECKELLFKLDFSSASSSMILHAMNHNGQCWQEFAVSKASIIQQTDTATPSIGSYLYEPNASIMKLGCFGDVAEQFSVIPIAQNSHLYVGDTSIAEFPGRQFLINEVIPFRDREIKALRKRFEKMNVSTRNFRLSAEALRQRLHVKDGGDFYLFGTTLASGELVLLLTTKINS